jgi:hypothetical protein
VCSKNALQAQPLSQTAKKDQGDGQHRWAMLKVFGDELFSLLAFASPVPTHGDR